MFSYSDFLQGCWIALCLIVTCLMTSTGAWAQVVELNSTGGTTATNGLHFYIENTTKMQSAALE